MRRVAADDLARAFRAATNGLLAEIPGLHEFFLEQDAPLRADDMRALGFAQR